MTINRSLGVAALVMGASITSCLGCTFSRTDLDGGLSAAQFFALPLGAVAIAEKCDPRTNLCQKYFDVTQCVDVNYPVMKFDDPTISVVTNTSKGCTPGDGCPVEKSYLAATFVYLNNKASKANLPTIEAIRSTGFLKPHSFEVPYRTWFDQIVPDSKALLFFKLQADPSSKLDDFEAEVVKYFHATTISNGDSSWEHKDVFGNAFVRSNACTTDASLCAMKGFLFAFTETPSGLPIPSLRLNTALANSDGVILTTFSPAGQSIYNKQMVIHFNWTTSSSR